MAIGAAVLGCLGLVAAVAVDTGCGGGGGNIADQELSRNLPQTLRQRVSRAQLGVVVVGAASGVGAAACGRHWCGSEVALDVLVRFRVVAVVAVVVVVLSHASYTLQRVGFGGAAAAAAATG